MVGSAVHQVWFVMILVVLIGASAIRCLAVHSVVNRILHVAIHSAIRIIRSVVRRMRNVVLVSVAVLLGNVALHRGAAVTPVRNVVLVRVVVQKGGRNGAVVVMVQDAFHQLVHAAAVI